MSNKSGNKKHTSGKYGCVTAFESGLNRREFLRQTGAATLFAGLLIYKPCIAKSLVEGDRNEILAGDIFTDYQKKILEAVQIQLFPADGDGPSAADINALPYLEWALTDPENIEDGDREFIIKGIGWLEDLSRETEANNFTSLSEQQQHRIIGKISKSEAGENWMSLLIYYLLEALLLDPVYGGNPDGIGWKWLAHQPGFPRPPKDKTYRYYQNSSA